MKNITIAVGGIVAVALFAIAGAFLVSNTHRAQADALSEGTVISVATTSTAIAVTSSTRVLATTTNPLGVPHVTSNIRIYATICNFNANPVFLNLNADRPASLTNATYAIALATGYSACYEVTSRNIYQGSITASSTNQTSTSVNVTDYVY